MSLLLKDCPICDLQPEDVLSTGGRDSYVVVCPVCGRYEISRSAAVTMPHEDSNLRRYLSAHTRQSWDYRGQVAQINTNWQALAEQRHGTSLAQKLDKLMFLARHRTGEPGGECELRGQLDYPLIDAPCSETFDFLFGHAVDAGLLRCESLSTSQITFKGWEFLDSRVGAEGAPVRAFVAMSFDDRLSAVFDNGIQPALEIDCGISCIRIDRIHHNEKICDKILAEIRRCPILIADVTLQRPGVYFEAGFALALDHTVIWAVREDEIRDVHFDTRQYNHIVWKDPQDLRLKLGDRIHATALNLPPARTSI